MNTYFTLFLFVGLQFSLTAQKTPQEVVQASLEAYNAHNIETFMSYFSEDIEMQNFQAEESFAEGLKAVREIFEPFFKASPDLHSHIVNRITFDNKVIDHESVTGSYGNETPFEVVVIYEVNEGKITKMTMVRKKK